MKQKHRFLLPLLMAIVMMAMSPTRVWADDYTITPIAGTENTELPAESYQSLFDGTTDTKWNTSTWFGYNNYAWVIFKIPTKARLTGYSLFDGNDTYHFYGRHWSWWKVYGANFPSDAYATLGSASWEVIDNRERQEYETGYDESEGIKRSDYTVTTDREYQYYMVRITDVGETLDATEWGDETEQQQMSEMTCTFSPANVTITSQPMDAAYRKGDTPQPLSVTAESNSDITYQWCKGEFYNNKWNYSTIQGATQSTYAPSTSEEGTTRYYCIVSAGGSAQKTYEATVNVQETTASIPTITTQPEASQTCYYDKGEEISLSIMAEVSDGGTLSYQWQKKSQTEEEFTDIEGATSSSYTVKPTSPEDVLIRCVVTNTCNGATSWINSQVSSIHVMKTPVILVTSENYESLGLAAKHIGYYALSTYDNLKWFCDKVNNDNANYKSAKVVLTRDIDAGCDATNQWTPIGTFATPFLGSFDGNGKTISNIYYDGENYAIGFFGYVGKKDFNDHIVIENLTIKNSTFKTTDFNAGGIVGTCKCSPVNIRNCHVIETTIQAGTIRGDGVIESGLYAGGIVACYELESTNTEPAYIENCSISGSVVSQCYIGGIAGFVSGTNNNQTPLIIRNCYTSAAVSGLAQLDNVYAGGAFGEIGVHTRVSNIYSRGTVTYSNSSDCVSAFAGMIVQSAIIRNCFYDNQVTQLPFATYGENTQLGPNCTGKTPEEFKSGEVTYLLNGSRSIGTEAFPLVWYQTLGADGDAYPTFDATHSIVYGDYDENTCIAHRYANDATTLTKTTPTHTLSHVEGTQANCLVAGNKEYWSCSACERLFLDEACNEEAIAQDVVIPANNDHLYPTDFTDGLKDCSRCGAVIEMEAAVQVSAENYTTFGFTAENYSAFVGYYAISKAGHLYWLADEVNNGRAEEGIKVVLTADIIVNDGTFDADGNYSPRNGANNATPRKWSPIGTWESPFCGTFEGNGHSISGLYVKDESKSHVGVIGSASNSIIQNLGVKDFYFVVMGNVGGICGDCFSTIINKCYATGYIDGAYSGGICGTLDDLKRDGKAKMSQCWANCHFLRSRLNSGGICGVLGGEAVMEDCFSMVNEPTDIFEGICYGGASGSTIINCYTNYTDIAKSSYHGIIMNSASKVDMATGEICWKLNGSVDDKGKWTAGPVDGSQTWYQKLGEDGDAAPVLTKAADGSNMVYWGYKNCTELGYDNKSMSATPLDIHDFTAHTPAATADEQTGLYATVCGYGCGTIEHGVKAIKDYAPNAEGMAKNLVLTVDAEGKYSVTEPIALTDANQFKDVQVDITAPAAPTFTRTMTSQWGTLVVPFDVVLNDGQQPFRCYQITDIADDQLTLKKLSGTLRANTPVLVRMNSDVLGQTDNLCLQASSSTLKAVKEVKPVAIGADDSYSLAGTYVKLEPASSDYFISNNSFWNVGYMLDKYPTAHVAVSPFRAYIKSAATSEAKQLVIGAYDDETTSIGQIENGTLYMVNGTCYNLNGQRLTSLRRGLNIINGKKILVK